MKSTKIELEVYKGKRAKIESTKPGSKNLRIVAKQTQGTDSKVSMYRITETESDGVCMAFCFEHGKKKYFPVVKRQKKKEGETVQFEVETLNGPPQEQDKTFLFKFTKGKDEWKPLSSVAEPGQYLSVSKRNQFTLSTIPQTHFRIHQNTGQSR